MVCHQALSTVGYFTACLGSQMLFPLKQGVVGGFDEREHEIQIQKTTCRRWFCPLNGPNSQNRRPESRNSVCDVGRKGIYLNNFTHINVSAITFGAIIVLLRWFGQESFWVFLFFRLHHSTTIVLLHFRSSFGDYVHFCSYECRASQFRKRRGWWASYSHQGGPPLLWKCATGPLRHTGPFYENHTGKHVNLQYCSSSK